MTTENTAIDVIARNESHQQYLQSLINQTSKYKFDVTAPQFLNLYYDTILRLFPSRRHRQRRTLPGAIR